MTSHFPISQHSLKPCGQCRLLTSRRQSLRRFQQQSTTCQAQGFGASQTAKPKAKAARQNSAQSKRSKKQTPAKQKPAPAPAPAAAVEPEIVDIEGSVVDMRIPVTVSCFWATSFLRSSARL